MLLSGWLPAGRRRILGAGDLFFEGCWDSLGKRFLPWLGAEGLWLQPWAEGPATTHCCSLSGLWSHFEGMSIGEEQLCLPVEVDGDVSAFFSTLEAAGLLGGVPSQELLGRELLDLGLDLLDLLGLLDLLQLLQLLELELELAIALLFSSLTGPEHSSLWASSLHWCTMTLLMLWTSGTVCSLRRGCSTWTSISTSGP